MAGPIKLSVVTDVKDVAPSMAKVDAAMDGAAKSAQHAGSRIDSAFESTAGHADDVASKGAQAAGALSGLGDLVGGKFGAGMQVGGVAMQAFADAGDLVNVVTESAIVKKIKDAAVTAAQTTATIAKTVADKAAAVASKAWAAAQWVLNAALEANPIGLVVAAIAALIAAIVLAIKYHKQIAAAVEAAWGAVKTAATVTLTAVRDFVANVTGKIKDTAIAAWTGIKTGTSTAWSAIKGFVVTPVQAAKSRLDDVIGKIKSAVSGAWSAIKSSTSTAWSGIKDKVTGPFQNIVDFVKGVPGKIKNLGGDFKNAGVAVIQRFVDGLGNLGSKAASFAGQIANAVKSAVQGAINGLIDKVNASLDITFKIPVVGKTVHINAPNIPHIALANGGITTGPTMALIGDNPGGREAVIPLDKYDIGGGDTYNVYLNGTFVGASKAEIGRWVTDSLEAYRRAGGRARAA